MASKIRHMFSSKLPNVTCLSNSGKQIVKFDEGAPRGTVCSTMPFTGPGSHSFEVLMKVKKVKTAVGVLAQGHTVEYMRDTSLAEPHVSFGGAGLIHPKELQAKHKYAEGHKVRVKVNFEERRVQFYVNDCYAGEDAWPHDMAYPAVSADGGYCELEISELSPHSL